MEKLKWLSTSFRDRMLNSLDEENKKVFLELEKSISGFDIDIVNLIVRWYLNPDLLDKYYSQENSIDWVKDLVEALYDFIENNNLVEKYEKNVNNYKSYVQKWLYGTLVIDSKVKPDEI